MPEPIRVAIYARVSTEQQEREDTIASQVSQLKETASKAGYELVEVYEDNGYSGSLLARPALDRLRDDAQKGLFKRVLIHSPDRLARKFLYQEIVMEDLRKHEVEVEFLNRKIAENPEDRLLLGVQGLFAEYEKAKIRERVRRGRLHKASKGLIVGTRAPYGYTYFKGSGKYEINPAEASVVKMIFDWVANHGFTLRQVVRELTNRGVPKPTSFGFRTQWGRSTVSRIIVNETYIGTSHYNKHFSVEPSKPRSKKVQRKLLMGRKLRPRDQWIPIPAPVLIERETFERAHERIKANRFMANGGKSRTYMLRGLVKCGNCGAPMTGDPSKGRPVYRCGNRERLFPLPRVCQVKTARADFLEAKVWGALRRALEDPGLLLSRRRQVEEGLEKRNAVSSQAADDANQERSRLQREENRLLEAYTSEAISLDQMRPQMERIKARRAALEEAAKPAVPQTVLDLKDFDAMRQAFFKGLKAAEADPSKKIEIVRLLVEKILVEPGQIRILGALPGPSQGLGSVHNLLKMWTVPVTSQPFTFELVESLAA